MLKTSQKRRSMAKGAFLMEWNKVWWRWRTWHHEASRSSVWPDTWSSRSSATSLSCPSHSYGDSLSLCPSSTTKTLCNEPQMTISPSYRNDVMHFSPTQTDPNPAAVFPKMAGESKRGTNKKVTKSENMHLADTGSGLLSGDQVWLWMTSKTAKVPTSGNNSPQQNGSVSGGLWSNPGGSRRGNNAALPWHNLHNKYKDDPDHPKETLSFPGTFFFVAKPQNTLGT